MDIVTTIGLVSAAISIPAVFIPDKWRSKKLVFITFIIIAAILSAVIVNQSSKLSRVKKVSKAANELIMKSGSNFTDKGFIQACLAFMEQNKDLYPESYDRAKEIRNKIKNSIFSSDDVSASYELKGLLTGIAILNNPE